jgi:hypothetical protein
MSSSWLALRIARRRASVNAAPIDAALAERRTAR